MVLAKFEKVIIELSNGDTWEEASKEWGFLYYKEKDTKDNNCGCGFKLKHQYYYYNKNTKKIICAGKDCKKHIDEYRGNKQYNNNFISDLNAIMDNEHVGDYDLQAWCENNKQRLWDRFFWRVDALMTEESLVKFAEYLDEMWFELVNLDVILDKIDEKLQIINDREEAEEKRIILQAKRVREQAEADEKQYQLYRDRMLKQNEEEKRRVIMSKKRRRKECEEKITRLKDEIRQMSYELKLEEEQLLKY